MCVCLSSNFSNSACLLASGLFSCILGVCLDEDVQILGQMDDGCGAFNGGDLRQTEQFKLGVRVSMCLWISDDMYSNIGCYERLNKGLGWGMYDKGIGEWCLR